jgi:hypothetical protein
MCKKWYDKRKTGEIISSNFQLHPPREKDSDEFHNECGNLLYPLLLWAEHRDGTYTAIKYNPEVMTAGECRVSPPKAAPSIKK